MKLNKKLKALAFVAALAGSMWVTSCSNQEKKDNGETTENTQKDLPAVAANYLKVPDGFSATVVADSIGPARHIAITKDGNIYVKLASPKEGKGVIMLSPAGQQAVVKSGFGDYDGTGIYVKDGYLYASSTTSVFRYKLNDKNEVVDGNNPEVIVSGLVDHDQHNSKSIVLDNDGNIYVNIGAFSNACQAQDRTKGSKGMKPCPILDSAGGIWRFKANVAGQTFKDGVRYATGLRNVVGLDWNQQTNKLFVMQHGRDQLAVLYPQYFDAKQSADLPAECMYELSEGSNCGWPYIYYDQNKKQKMVGPEYGGDGKKVSNDKNIIDPVAAYPGHMAPNGLLFYTGTQFPEKYKNGAFIAFHGSWNRAPEPQEGFYVVFQPFADGKPSGDYEVFVDGFYGSGPKTAEGKAVRRPCGLAQGPDGSLYVTDDSKGGIFKISYGNATAAPAGAGE
jgi:glucose/arabinose dehydrogenase